MSNEGLLLTSSHEVRLVVDLLRLRITPDDKILRLQTAYEYALVQGMKGLEALSAALNEEVVIPQNPTAPSLEEQVACIIDTLRLEAKVSARPYLQAFQDRCYVIRFYFSGST